MIKRRNYTFALTRDNDRVIKIVEKYPKYAYIKHDKDDAEVHYHYYIEFSNPRSLTAVAHELQIPENMIEQVYSKRGILEYLTHENAKGKHHYDPSEIFSNFDVKTEASSDERKTSHDDYWLIVNTIDDYKSGKITFKEMTKIVEPLICLASPIRIYDMFMRTPSSRNVGLSTFRVPCSNTSVNNGTKKKGGDMT